MGPAHRAPAETGLRGRIDRDEDALIGPAAERNPSGDGGKDGVVLAHPDVSPGVELGAALADDDVASDDGFAAELLHAAILRVGVATVPRAALSLFVSHSVLCLKNLGDFNTGYFLPVSVFSPVVFPSSFFRSPPRRAGNVSQSLVARDLHNRQCF